VKKQKGPPSFATAGLLSARGKLSRRYATGRLPDVMA